MIASISSDLTAEKADALTTSAAQSASSEHGVIARIDFAHVINKQFLVYGWILGFTSSVYSASIHLGSVVVDLIERAIPIPRPDIAQHFSLETSDDKHGFYAIIDLAEEVASVDHLRLSVTLFSGETTVSRWPFSAVSSATEPYLGTFSGLLQYLPRQEAQRLIEFAAALGLRMNAEYPPTLPPPIRFGIDLCCILENRVLLVFGSVFDPVKELTLAQLRIGRSVFNFLENSLLVSPPDTNLDLGTVRNQGTSQLPAFVFVQALPAPDVEAPEAQFALAAGGGILHLTRPVTHIAQDARRDFLALLGKMDADSVLALIEQVAIAFDGSLEQRSFLSLLELVRRSAIEHLPVSIQHSRPRCTLQVDLAVRVADKGIFLTGWFNADTSVSPRVVCHCGGSTFVMSDHWIRHLRPDVTSHLVSAGIQPDDDLHGFSCYIPLGNRDAPYCLSVALESGEMWNMRVTLPEKAESALQSVRSLLTWFDSENPDLRLLLDRQVGPAVETVWAARRNPSRKPLVRIYGMRQKEPTISIIVPLYGRHDFAEYQMALFADDPEFQRVELIYVVDDPAIFVEFSGLCADLYELYRVPFILAFSGANLGFAGANNFGAEVARGQYLLFVNSDVLPKRPLWAGELLQIYKSLANPGLLGAKLLYEDGSLQHAGIAFRRYAQWGDLWINDHPFKGQSPLGLSGVREVDAVTAACALIEASLYRELGGFSEDYIIGDFEDSDLCLRARSAGRPSYVALDVELYHLERQSQNRTGDGAWRVNLTVYNCWLHNSRWAKLIEETASRNLFDGVA